MHFRSCLLWPYVSSRLIVGLFLVPLQSSVIRIGFFSGSAVRTDIKSSRDDGTINSLLPHHRILQLPFSPLICRKLSYAVVRKKILSRRFLLDKTPLAKANLPTFRRV